MKGSIKKHILLFIITSILTLPALADRWKVKLNPTPNGSWTASLINKESPTKNETVGNYGTKKEARKAGKAAKKDKGVMPLPNGDGDYSG